jgi:tripartite ATP-independent transporter DctM subunit
MDVLIIIGTFFMTLLMGMPISFSLGLTGLVAILTEGTIPYEILPLMMWNSIARFPFLAVAFFFLAGGLMIESGIMDDLLNLTRLLVGRIRGGLAQVNIVASMLFGGISGAAVSDVASIGAILIPAMVKEGYDREYSTAITAVSSIIGPIIPPSLVMIFLGISANLPIGALFAAGYIPGIIYGLLLMVMAYIEASKNKVLIKKQKYSFIEAIIIIKRGMVPLLMPVIIMGGILGGVFTATESAAVACIYALFVGFIVYKKLTLKKVFILAINAAITVGSLQLILSMSGILGWTIAAFRVTQLLSEFLLSLSTNPIIIMFLINILLLIAGMILDPAVSVIILSPILFPIVTKIGYNPLHFGMIMSINLIIGLITPPVGNILFVASSVGKVSIERLIIKTFPYYLAMLILLLLVIFIPEITLFVPRLFGLYI